MKCERCDSIEAVEPVGGAHICEKCVTLIVAEWRIHREEFAQLSEAQS